MSELIEFLETIKNSKDKFSYALTDGWEVIIWKGQEDGEDSETILVTDIHSVLRDIMSHYNLKDHSP